jgi:hypothetical protein
MTIMKRAAAGAFVLILAVCCPRQAGLPESTSDLSFSEIHERRLNSSIYSFTGLAVSSGGAVYSTRTEHREVYKQTQSGSSKLLYLRVYDTYGRGITQPEVAPFSPSMLLDADPDDHVYFIGVRVAGQQELIRTRLTLR